MQHFKSKNNAKDQNVIPKIHRCLPTHFRPSHKDAGTFTLFPQLPTEIRLKIWNIALHFPIRVDLRVVRDRSWNPVAEFKIIRHSMNPCLTAVCVEAREEALQHHTLCFDMTSYINFATDRGVCLRNRKAAGFNVFMSHLTPYELASIENLILKLSVWRESSDTGFQHQIRKLTGLKMLQFLVEDSDEDFAFAVTKDVIRQELMQARGEHDRAWKAPRVFIIDPYGLEKDERRPKNVSG